MGDSRIRMVVTLAVCCFQAAVMAGVANPLGRSFDNYVFDPLIRWGPGTQLDDKSVRDDISPAVFSGILQGPEFESGLVCLDDVAFLREALAERLRYSVPNVANPLIGTNLVTRSTTNMPTTTEGPLGFNASSGMIGYYSNVGLGSLNPVPDPLPLSVVIGNRSDMAMLTGGIYGGTGKGISLLVDGISTINCLRGMLESDPYETDPVIVSSSEVEEPNATNAITYQVVEFRRKRENDIRVTPKREQKENDVREDWPDIQFDVDEVVTNFHGYRQVEDVKVVVTTNVYAYEGSPFYKAVKKEHKSVYESPIRTAMWKMMKVESRWPFPASFDFGKGDEYDPYPGVRPLDGTYALDVFHGFPYPVPATADIINVLYDAIGKVKVWVVSTSAYTKYTEGIKYSHERSSQGVELYNNNGQFGYRYTSPESTNWVVESRQSISSMRFYGYAHQSGTDYDDQGGFLVTRRYQKDCEPEDGGDLYLSMAYPAWMVKPRANMNPVIGKSSVKYKLPVSLSYSYSKGYSNATNDTDYVSGSVSATVYLETETATMEYATGISPEDGGEVDVVVFKTKLQFDPSLAQKVFDIIPGKPEAMQFYGPGNFNESECPSARNEKGYRYSIAMASWTMSIGLGVAILEFDYGTTLPAQ